MNVDGTLTVGQTRMHGTVNGNGQIVGNVFPEDGPFHPGGSGIGVLTIDGEYMPNAGSLDVQLGGTQPGTEYDQLVVTGRAHLRGDIGDYHLNVSLINNHTPSAGDSYTILTANPRLGTFTTTNLPTLPSGLAWDVVYASDSVMLNVVSTNSPPTITSTPTITATEGLHYTYDVDATDPDLGDVLTYSLDTAPAGMTIDASSGLIQWTPTAAQVGGNPVAVRVTDSIGQSTAQSFNVSVGVANAPPIITSTPTITATEGLLYAYDVDATDPNVGDVLSYSLDTAPAGMTIDASSGLIQWIPTAAQVGGNSVAVRVTDPGGLFATQSFNVTVAANSPPIITSTPTTTAFENRPYAYDVDATDADVGDVLTYSLDTAPAGMTVGASSGLIRWTPTTAQLGGNSVAVRVTDSRGRSDTQSFDVTAVPFNQRPSIGSKPVVAATEGQLYTYDVFASDQGDILTYSLDTAPAGMTIDASSGLIQWIPTAAQVGGNSVAVRVTDTGGLFATQSFNVTVAANSPPIITSTPTTTAFENRPYAYDVDATDADVGDVLTYSLDTAPAGMTIDASSGLIRWTPTTAQLGGNSVAVRVTDSGGRSDTQSYNVTAVPFNQRPSIGSKPVTNATEGQLYTYDVFASDQGILTYSLDTAPAGMTIDASSGLIQWTPTAAQVGGNSVAVRVTDTGGLFATQNFNVTVAATTGTSTFVLTVDDPLTAGVDVIVVDDGPVGTATMLGPSTHADANIGIGYTSFLGSVGAFPVVHCHRFEQLRSRWNRTVRLPKRSGDQQRPWIAGDWNDRDGAQRAYARNPFVDESNCRCFAKCHRAIRGNRRSGRQSICYRVDIVVPDDSRRSCKRSILQF